MRGRFGWIVWGLFASPLAWSAEPVVPEDDDAKTPVVRWVRNEEFAGNDPHQPLVVGDRVIVGTDKGEIRAYRCGDGAPLWVFEHGKRIFHQPCSDGQRLFFSSDAGVTALNVDNGVEIWNFGHANCDGPTLVLGKLGAVYVGGDHGGLIALDAANGRQLWGADFAADAPPDPPGFDGQQARMEGTKARPSSLASDGETLFLSVFDQCRVIAVDAGTGERRWAYQAEGWVYGSAVATETSVFFGSQDKHFYCLDKKTGRRTWRHETNGRIESGGAVDDKFVYFGSCDGTLYCLNQSDGRAKWRFEIERIKGGVRAIYSVPQLGKVNAYFAAGEGRTYAVNRTTGKLTWELRPSDDSELYCSPASDGKLFFVTSRVHHGGGGEASLIAIGRE